MTSSDRTILICKAIIVAGICWLSVLALLVAHGCESTTRPSAPAKVEPASPSISKATDGIGAACAVIQVKAEDSAVKSEDILRQDPPPTIAEPARIIRENQVGILEQTGVINSHTQDLRTALDRVKQLEGAQDSLIAANAGLRDEADKWREKYESGEHRMFAWFKGVAIAFALIAGGLAVWQFISGNVKAAMMLGITAGTLIAGAALLTFLEAWWQWIAGGVGLSVLGLIAYLVFKTVRERQKDRALSVIVPEIQATDPMGTGIKAKIGDRAAKLGIAAENAIKATIGAVKVEAKKKRAALDRLAAVTA